MLDRPAVDWSAGRPPRCAKVRSKKEHSHATDAFWIDGPGLAGNFLARTRMVPDSGRDRQFNPRRPTGSCFRSDTRWRRYWSGNQHDGRRWLRAC